MRLIFSMVYRYCNSLSVTVTRTLIVQWRGFLWGHLLGLIFILFFSIKVKLSLHECHLTAHWELFLKLSLHLHPRHLPVRSADLSRWLRHSSCFIRSFPAFHWQICCSASPLCLHSKRPHFLNIQMSTRAKQQPVCLSGFPKENNGCQQKRYGKGFTSTQRECEAFHE